MKKLGSILLSALFVFGSGTPALANSAQRYFEGVSPVGTIVTGEQSPIVVEREDLTFDLQEFPLDWYDELEKYLAYNGKVTAEYTFYNPTDYDVTATLVFPFGQTPDYGYRYDWETEQAVSGADAEKYDIAVNGAPIEKTVRYTLFYPGETFALEKDMAKLIDGYREDAFYRPDLPVTKYTYAISGVDTEKYDAATAAFFWNGDASKTKLLLEQMCGGSGGTDSISVHMWVDMEETVTLYVFGEPLNRELQWNFYENGGCEKEIAGEMIPMGTEAMTFEEFIEAVYGTGGEIPPSDWYNAIVESLHRCEWEFGVLGNFEYSGYVTTQDLLRWYEYEITVPAGERIVNTVTAPLYPAIDREYEPEIYEYTYLLSPAKAWADFGTLDIVVNTPYYMTESGGEISFAKTESGYAASLEGLPEEELEFTLSTEETSRRKSTYGSIFSVGKPLLLITAGVIVAVLLWSRKKGA